MKKILLIVELSVNFINVLHAHFLYKIFGAKISSPKAKFVQNLGAKKELSYKKTCAKNVEDIVKPGPSLKRPKSLVKFRRLMARSSRLP